MNLFTLADTVGKTKSGKPQHTLANTQIDNLHDTQASAKVQTLGVKLADVEAEALIYKLPDAKP